MNSSAAETAHWWPAAADDYDVAPLLPNVTPGSHESASRIHGLTVLDRTIVKVADVLEC